jgi:mono/diheme cytochrome c family protein
MRTAFVLGSCVAMLLLACGCSQQTTLGRDLYVANCASCHGRYGEGDGPAVADSPRAMPDLRYLAKRNDGVFPAARVAAAIDGREVIRAHGDRMMPVWGNIFGELDGANERKEARSTDKIKEMVDYLASIQLKD